MAVAGSGQNGQGWQPRVSAWCYDRRHWADGHGVGPRPSLVGGTAMVRAIFCMSKVREKSCAHNTIVGNDSLHCPPEAKLRDPFYIVNFSILSVP